MINIEHYTTVGIPGRIVTRVDGDIQLPGNAVTNIYVVLVKASIPAQTAI